MATSRRVPRGGPAGQGGGRAPEGARLVAPSTSRTAAEQMKSAMTPGRPARVQLMQERLNANFFREAWSELKKVHWPTPLQARNLTLLVIGVSLAVGMILGGIDFIFAKIFQVLLG